MKSLSNDTKKLESLFSILNEKYYNNSLSIPVITISPDTTKGVYGWCTSKKVWQETSESKTAYYEINICAEYLNRAYEKVAETMLHEMAHLYNLEHGIKDTSRHGTYHNKKFENTAKQHGLVVEKNAKYGWSEAKLNEDAQIFIKSLNTDGFSLCRLKNEKKSQNQSSRKYVCPQCGCIIRATKEVHVICAKCNKTFRLEKAAN